MLAARLLRQALVTQPAPDAVFRTVPHRSATAA
jgi:hypothetical protein